MLSMLESVNIALSTGGTVTLPDMLCAASLV